MATFSTGYSVVRQSLILNFEIDNGYDERSVYLNLKVEE